MSSQSVKKSVSSKNFSQECCAIVSSKSVLPHCQISVSCQGVPQICPVEDVIRIAFLPRQTCQHSGSWVSSRFFSNIFLYYYSIQYSTERCFWLIYFLDLHNSACHFGRTMVKISKLKAKAPSLASKKPVTVRPSTPTRRSTGHSEAKTPAPLTVPDGDVRKYLKSENKIGIHWDFLRLSNFEIASSAKPFGNQHQEQMSSWIVLFALAVTIPLSCCSPQRKPPIFCRCRGCTCGWTTW